MCLSWASEFEGQVAYISLVSGSWPLFGDAPVNPVLNGSREFLSVDKFLLWPVGLQKLFRSIQLIYKTACNLMRSV